MVIKMVSFKPPIQDIYNLFKLSGYLNTLSTPNSFPFLSPKKNRIVKPPKKNKTIETLYTFNEPPNSLIDAFQVCVIMADWDPDPVR